ncbi:Glycosyl hydrolases family 16 (GH16) domain profile [Nakaseomyces glabratus]|nr:Glycosyl hydrolases family 16 (GH16) domain profile [Nakaseomyces glabratus]
MLYNYKRSLAVGILASVVAADSCDPLKQTNCPADKALATSFSENFTSESKWFTAEDNPGKIEYTSDGLAMSLTKRFDNPSLKSNFYIMYGKTEVIFKAGDGRGIVSSFFLQSDDLDEIDLEWIGSDDTQFQSNYFSKGNTATYDRGEFHGVNQPQKEFHNYTIDWTMEQLTWYLDGQVVRVLPNTTSQGYPQTPMYIKMGIWAGGDPSNAPGTIEWAGGETDYSLAPFTMYIKSLVVTDYSTGKEYTYGDQSGSWQSIKAVDGEINGRYQQAQEDFAKLVAGQAIESSQSSSVSPTSSSSSSASSSTSSSASSSASSSSSSSISSSSSASSSAQSSSSSIASSVSSIKSVSSSAISSSKSSQTAESKSSTSSSVKPTTQSSKTDTIMDNVTHSASTSNVAKSTVSTVAKSTESSTHSVQQSNFGVNTQVSVVSVILGFIFSIVI